MYLFKVRPLPVDGATSHKKEVSLTNGEKGPKWLTG